MLKLEQRGFIHSRIILVSFMMYISNLLHRNLDSAIKRILDSLRTVPFKLILIACKTIEETVDEMFWEVSIIIKSKKWFGFFNLLFFVDY